MFVQQRPPGQRESDGHTEPHVLTDMEGLSVLYVTESRLSTSSGTGCTSNTTDACVVLAAPPSLPTTCHHPSTKHIPAHIQKYFHI